MDSPDRVKLATADSREYILKSNDCPMVVPVSMNNSNQSSVGHQSRISGIIAYDGASRLANTILSIR